MNLASELRDLAHTIKHTSRETVAMAAYDFLAEQARLLSSRGLTKYETSMFALQDRFQMDEDALDILRGYLDGAGFAHRLDKNVMVRWDNV